MRKVIGALFVLVFIFVSTPSHAYFITSSGDASLTGASVDDFEGWTAGASWAGAYGADISYVANDNHFGLLSDFSGLYNTSGQYLDNNNYEDNGFSSLTITFNNGTAAFGFNWGAAEPWAAWELTAFDASDTLLESYILPSTGPSNAGEFFGIAADNISYATLSWGGEYDWIFIDNMTYATNAPVPEPSTILLLGGGLAGLAFYRRKRK